MEIVASAMKVGLDNERDRPAAYEETRRSVFIVDVGAEMPPPASMSDAATLSYEKVQRTLVARKNAALLWAARGAASMQAEETRAVEAATAAIAGIETVREGHAAMRQNIDHLSRNDVTALLKKATDDLRSIGANLKKLRGGSDEQPDAEHG